MKSDKLHILLEKYWEGTATQEEEIQLKEYFSPAEAYREFPKEAVWFHYLRREKQLTDKNDLDFSFLDEEKGSSSSWNFSYYLKIAAAIAVVAISSFFVYKEINENKTAEKMITDTFEDPQKAFEETKKALYILSKNLGKGQKEIQKASMLHEAKEKLENDQNTKN